MTFNDVFKSSFLENVTQFSAVDTLIGMLFAIVISLFIFVVYKKTFNGVMYSSGFALTLVGLSVNCGGDCHRRGHDSAGGNRFCDHWCNPDSLCQSEDA